jgi:hypothetical protein
VVASNSGGWMTGTIVVGVLLLFIVIVIVAIACCKLTEDFVGSSQSW